MSQHTLRKKETVNIALVANEIFFHGLLAAVVSTIVNCSKKVDLHFFILDGGISDPSWNLLSSFLERYKRNVLLSRIPFDNAIFSKHHTPLECSRILIPDLISEKRIIYLDSDMFMLRDISELWGKEFGESFVMAVQDPKVNVMKYSSLTKEVADFDENSKYFNSGLMYINLEAWRKSGIHKQMIEFYLSSKGARNLRFLDQTILNLYLSEKVSFLEKRWNTWSYDLAALKLKDLDYNIHYVSGVKPWNWYKPTFDFQVWYSFMYSVGLCSSIPWIHYGLCKSYIQETFLYKLMPSLFDLRGEFNLLLGDKSRYVDDLTMSREWGYFNLRRKVMSRFKNNNKALLKKYIQNLQVTM